MSKSDFRTGFIAIVGRPNVGKSTLLNHLIGQKISITSKKAQTTRHRITGIYTDADAQLVFVDTPGFQTQHLNQLNRGMNRVVTQSLQGVDVVLFVIEALRFDERDKQVLQLLPQDIPVLLVINKVDRVAEKNRLLPFIESVAQAFSFAAVMPVSAAKDLQLDDLRATLRGYLPAGAALYDENEITDKSERFLAAEIIREKLFRLLGEELPYSVSVMIEKMTVEKMQRKPGDLRKINAAIIVEKDGQKAMVIGKDGEKLKKIATDARKDMEKLFEGKVFLEVWVKVKSGWSDDARVLKSLGYD